MNTFNHIIPYYLEPSLKEVGGKSYALHQILDINIPKWFTIKSTSLPQATVWPANSTFESELIAEINLAISEIFPMNHLFAVRSSAVDEDGNQNSFAGQFDTFLYVAKDQLLSAIKKVWESGFSDIVKSYRESNQLGDCIPPAIMIQEMIDAEKAGVAFSVNPVNGSWGEAVVSSVWGLGKGLVDGTIDADTWVVSRDHQIVQSEIKEKTKGFFLHENQETLMDIPPEKRNQPSLLPKEIIAIATLAKQCAKQKNLPQDIEWAICDNQLYLLQSRPITSLNKIVDQKGKFNIWDNSNIAESYGGITSPLTFTFARDIYEAVYKQFCRLMKVSPQVIADNESAFKGLLGLINGRMYYNLINWYYLISFFPGYRLNRGFMEQMMGVQKELGDTLASQIKTKNSSNSIMNSLRFISSLIGLGINFLTIDHQTKKFYQRLNDALHQHQYTFEEQSVEELADSFENLEKKLLLKWDAPLVNDFFAMIFFGILSSLCKKWCADENGTLQNNLVGGEGNVISTEPARRVNEISQLVKNNQKLLDLFSNGTYRQIHQALSNYPDVHREVQSYLEKFGDRCLDELKLESPTLHDDPTSLYRAIASFALRDQVSKVDNAFESRQKAETIIEEKLASSWFKRTFFKWILKNARKRVANRENLRFERTRLFGQVRKIFVEIGKRFVSLGILKNEKDIFYLEKNEIIQYVTGHISCPDLNAIANIRKENFANYEKQKTPDDRIETKGLVYIGNLFQTSASLTFDKNDHMLQGIGCCPGVIRGKVVVVKDPKGVEIPPGSILVAERTDPGWIMLFPAASGLLVERGSLLSHSAIVARELSLPAIVSVKGLTQWLVTGDEVEFDGTTGTIVKLKGDSLES